MTNKRSHSSHSSNDRPEPGEFSARARFRRGAGPLSCAMALSLAAQVVKNAYEFAHIDSVMSFIIFAFCVCGIASLVGAAYLDQRRKAQRRRIQRRKGHRIEVYKVRNSGSGSTAERWAAICHGDSWSTVESSQEAATRAAWFHAPSAAPSVLSIGPTDKGKAPSSPVHRGNVSPTASKPTKPGSSSG